ncbi:MAG: alpha/beta fold hydrolase, partial [Shimia sp.]|nr:alpha/beta fold hydrolase [Shimia sp.]
MTHIFRKLAIAFGLLILCGVVAWHVLPSQVAKGLISLNNASAGLSAKVISTDVGDIHYLEGGQGETVLLVHGIYARKEHWVEVARALTKDYRVIAVDLPGFGDNALRADDDYLLDQQQAN